MNRKLATVVVVDAGGRGHVLVEAYVKSPHVGKVIAIPGNDFMTGKSSKPVITYPLVKTTHIAEIVRICQEEQLHATVLVDVAQDNAVEAGLADAIRDVGIAAVGPSKGTGRIEWDKAWSRLFMQRAGILQPEFHVCTSTSEGKDFLVTHSEQKWFVKASGLAEGKGALSAHSNEEAARRIDEIQKFGEAAQTYLLEDWLEGDQGKPGEEFSAFAYCDGKTWQLVGYAQDHKRTYDGDQGENTGGMGCSTPPQVINHAIDEQTRSIFSNIFTQLAKEGTPYQGVLYFGGMVVEKNGQPTVYAIECNARWGDPEAEVLIPSIQNDFFELNMAVAQGRLDTINLQTDHKTRLSIAIASQGYPGDYSLVKGKKVKGLEKIQQIPHVKVYGAGLQRSGDDYVVNGGRICHIVAEATSTDEAHMLANSAAELIQVEGDHGENLSFHRTDIGWRDLQR